MDREMREYLDQKLLVLATKDDVEKLRQESRANLRQLREEIDLIREEAKEGFQKVRLEIQSTYDQANRAIDQSLQRFREEGAAQVIQWREEFKADIGLLSEGMDRLQQQVKGMEEGAAQVIQWREEFKAGIGTVRERMDRLQQQVKQMAEEFATLDARIKEGFTEVKEELGSMIKFSYADLEKRFNALEARVKALEKMVLP